MLRKKKPQHKRHCVQKYLRKLENHDISKMMFLFMSICPLLLEPFGSHTSSISLCTSDQTLFKQQCGTRNSDTTEISASEICVKKPADKETCSPEAADKSAYSPQSRGLGCSSWIGVGGWAACFNERLHGDSEDRHSSTTNYSAAQHLEPLLGSERPSTYSCENRV